MSILGAVIAGGQSRRFGSDKALAELDGRALIDHAITGLSDQCDALVICGRHVPGLTCVADRPAPDLGPLGGLAGALHYAASNGFEGVLTSACDTPEIPAHLATTLCGRDPAVFAGQPLFGWWPAQLCHALDAYLAATESRGVGDWVVWADARRIAWSREIPNINTPADLTALQMGRLLTA